MILIAEFDSRGKIYFRRGKTIYTLKKALELWPKLEDEIPELVENFKKAPYVRIEL